MASSTLLVCLTDDGDIASVQPSTNPFVRYYTPPFPLWLRERIAIVKLRDELYRTGPLRDAYISYDKKMIVLLADRSELDELKRTEVSCG